MHFVLWKPKPLGLTYSATVHTYMYSAIGVLITLYGRRTAYLIDVVLDESEQGQSHLVANAISYHAGPRVERV